MATATKPPTFGEMPTPQQDTRVNGTSPQSRDRAWHEWMMIGVGLTAMLTVVAIIASVVALSSKTSTTTTIIRHEAAAASRSTSTTMGSSMMGGSPVALGSGAAQAGAGAVIPVVLQLDAPKGIAGTVTGKDGWPRYSPSNITVPAGKKVTLVITNYDDVATALNAGVPYNRVMGGTETVNGKPVTYVGNKTIAHTFTVTGLGLNIAIPKAPTGGSVTVTYTFIAHKAGTYTWQCYTPCGSGNNGMGGPMMRNGFMQGIFKVA